VATGTVPYPLLETLQVRGMGKVRLRLVRLGLRVISAFTLPQ